MKAHVTGVEYLTGKGDWQKSLLFIFSSHSEKSESSNCDKNKNRNNNTQVY